MEMYRNPLESLEFEAAQAEHFGAREADLRRVLVFDRDAVSRSMFTDCIPEDFLTYACSTTEEVASELLARKGQPGGFDLLVWSIGTDVEEDLRSLREVREIQPHIKIVLLASQEALAHAVQIRTAEAHALILKPARPQDVRFGLEKALKSETEGAIERTCAHETKPQEIPKLAAFPGSDLGLIGDSPEMRRIISLVRKVGPSSVSVLITGESGTGKEMVANALHRVSDRSGKPFVALNCAAIPKELLESELFGHAKGAFTGATSARKGLFEEAHEGTILLDEIGDLPHSLQAKILRLIQTREVKAVGQNSVKTVNVRIISATHKNLKSLIQKGEFREDLYYRLNVMPVHLPPLRERKDDIILLAEYFLKRYHEIGRGPLRGLTRKACAKLMNLPWKGNVRELENVIERAIVLAEGDLINDTDIVSEESEPAHFTAEDLFNAGLSLRDIEREYIKYVLERTGNRKEAATRILGIDRKTLYRKEKLYSIRQADN